MYNMLVNGLSTGYAVLYRQADSQTPKTNCPIASHQNISVGRKVPLFTKSALTQQWLRTVLLASGLRVYNQCCGPRFHTNSVRYQANRHYISYCSTSKPSSQVLMVYSMPDVQKLQNLNFCVDGLLNLPTAANTNELVLLSLNLVANRQLFSDTPRINMAWLRSELVYHHIWCVFASRT